MERRVTFFLVAAVTCGVLTPLAPADFRWVPMLVGVVYLVLAGLTAIEQWSEGRRERHREPGAGR